MKRRVALVVTGLLLAGATAATARADDFGFSFSYGRGGYYAPCAPIVYYDCAPVIVRPAPIVCYDYPVYYRTTRVYRSYGAYGYGGYRGYGGYWRDGYRPRPGRSVRASFYYDD